MRKTDEAEKTEDFPMVGPSQADAEVGTDPTRALHDIDICNSAIPSRILF